MQILPELPITTGAVHFPPNFCGFWKILENFVARSTSTWYIFEISSGEIEFFFVCFEMTRFFLFFLL